MEQAQLNWIANFIWGIADDVLRDLKPLRTLKEVRADILVLAKETEGLLAKLVGRGVA